MSKVSHSLTIKEFKNFWSKVKKTKRCWLWSGGKLYAGYGIFNVGGKSCVAHRVSMHINGVCDLQTKIKNNYKDIADHLCRNKSCVNPEHLRITDQRTNVLSGNGLTAKLYKRKSCSRGHKFTKENTYRYSKDLNTRHCIKCRKIYAERWKNGRKKTI